MPLEWWYVMTEQVSMRDPDYSLLENAELAAQVVENAAVTQDWSAFLAFPEVLSIDSSADLILLSYAHPLTYQDSTIILYANSGLEFDLTEPVIVNDQALRFQALGALDAPFSGTVRYAELSEELFISESTLKYRIKQLLQRFGCGSRQELADMLSAYIKP